jgi:hypothetical protein
LRNLDLGHFCFCGFAQDKLDAVPSHFLQPRSELPAITVAFCNGFKQRRTGYT